jgi:hypothetical protein
MGAREAPCRLGESTRRDHHQAAAAVHRSARNNLLNRSHTDRTPRVLHLNCDAITWDLDDEIHAKIAGSRSELHNSIAKLREYLSNVSLKAHTIEGLPLVRGKFHLSCGAQRFPMPLARDKFHTLCGVKRFPMPRKEPGS